MPTDTRTPDDIERDIERERAGLARSVDQLQERFSPDYIVSEFTRGVREHGGDIATAVSRSVKQNPMAVALTGVGLAWMIFGRSHDDHDHDHHDARHETRHDETGGRGFGYATTSARAAPAGRGSVSTNARRGYYGGDASQAGRYRSYPTWALDDDDDDDGRDDGHDDNRRSLRDRASGAGSAARDAAGRASAQASSAAGAVGATGRSAAESASAGAARAKDGARGAAAGAADRADRVRRRLAQGTENMSEAARERIVAARRRAVDTARRADASARRNYAIGRDAAADFVEEQPLVAGALALAVGAAIAGALPRTRREDELLGDTRDSLFDEAERIFHEEKEKAERVASAALDEAGTVAEEKREKVDRSAPGDKSAAQAVADEVRDAGKRVEQAASGEAERQGLGKPRT